MLENGMQEEAPANAYYADEPTAPLDNRLPVSFFRDQVYDRFSSEGGELAPNLAREWIKEHADDPRVEDLKHALGAPNKPFYAPVVLPPSTRPLHRTIEFIRIAIPGRVQNVVVRKLKPHHILRFKRQYEAWKSGAKQAETGTPLRALVDAVPPILKAHQVPELQHFEVTTVEALCAMPDGIASAFMGLRKIQDEARTWLSAKTSSAPVSDLRIKLAEEAGKRAQLEQRLADMEQALRKQAADAAGPATPIPAEVTPATRKRTG